MDSSKTSAASITVGALVENFGAIVKIVAIDSDRGALVEIVPAERNGSMQGGIGQRYWANPQKCLPAASL